MKKIVKNKKMTIDKLAIMVAKGFENTASKEDLRNLEERMNGKLEGVNKRIDDFAETKASKIQYKELENRVQKIEAKI